MLAYVFWHRPFAHIDRQDYEEAVLRFQAELDRQKPPGFLSAVSFRIEPVPWLNDQPGYEDWYFVEASWSLDPLNAFAVAGHMQAPHDNVAAQMDQGHGGLFARAGGEARPPERSSVYWLTRPRGIQWRDALDPVRAKCPQATIWRRQMVLGSAAEFAIEAPGDIEIEVPSGWQARRVHRIRLGSSQPR
jgi:hypothetical protein